MSAQPVYRNYRPSRKEKPEREETKRHAETYIGLIEEILASDVELNEDAQRLIAAVDYKLQHGVPLMAREIHKVESIYGFVCRG